jgi:hypothetical protein
MQSVPEPPVNGVEPPVPPEVEAEPAPVTATVTARVDAPAASDAAMADKMAADEIQRQDDAQDWDPSKVQSGVTRSPYVPTRPPAGGMLVQPRPHREEPPPVIDSPRTQAKLNSLEDLYRAFPQIGDGMTFLRVERKAPKVWGGAVVAGILKDLHEQISVQDFHGQFGGHDYMVSVMGPDVARSDDDLTQPKMREMARLRLQFPGPPAFGTAPLSMNEDDYMLRGQQQGFPRAVPFIDPQVEMKRMELEEAQRVRQSNEVKELAGKYGQLVADASRAPEGVIKSLETAQDRSFTEMKQAHESVLANLRESNTNALRANTELEKQVHALQNEMVAVKTKAAEDVRNGETKVVGELKERYAKDFIEIKERHATEMSELKDRYNRELTEAKDRLNVEVRRVTDECRTKLDEQQRQFIKEGAEARERSQEQVNQARSDARERAEQLKSDFARAETNLREDYKTRMTELQHSTDREIKSVKDERDRTIQSIQSTAAGEAKWTEKTAEQRIKILESEATRLESKAENLERENRDLRAKMNKPIPEAIAEAQALAGMTGMIRAEDAPATSEEGEFDIKKSAVKLVGSLIEKGPEIAEKFQQMRAQNAQQRQVVQAQAQAQAQQNGQPGARQLAPTQMTRQPPQASPPQQRRVAPPPGMASAPPPAWQAAPIGPPMPSSIPGAPPPYQGAPPPGATGPMLRPAVVYGPTPEGPASAPAVGQQPAVAAAASPVQPPPAPVQPAAAHEPEMPTQWMGGPPAAAAQAAPAQPAATGPLDNIDPALIEQGMGRFVNELDNAIRDKVLSPLAFANLFIAEVGAPVAAQLMQSIPPEQIIQVVASLPEGDRSQIVTREGQKYVRAVWLACATQLGLVAA